MKTKGLIAVLGLAMGISLAVGCSGGQTTSDGVPDNTASSEPTTAPSPTTPATTPPTSNPTTPPTTTGTTAPTTPPTSTGPSVPTSTGSATPTSGPPDAKNGEKLFADNKCDGCHGSKKKPGRIPLFALKWDGKEKEKAAQMIRKGKGEMPKFDKLTDSQVADLVEFVSTK